MDGADATGHPDIAVFLYEPGDGGLDRVAILLANGFAARGLRTEIWLTRTDGPSRFLLADTVTVRIVPALRTRNRGLALALQVFSLARMVKRHEPAVLLSAGNQSNLTIALATRMARNGRTAAIQKITNPIARPGGRGRFQAIREWRFGLTARLGAKTLTLSEADARTYASAYPAAASKFVMVHNPYVTDAMLAIGAARQNRLATNGPVQLLSVARFSPQKDHANLINALSLIKELDWQITLAGDGYLRAECEAQVSALGLADRVHFAGFVDDPARLFAAADVFVLSSRWEGMPAVPIEALACGCLLVATDCAPGLRDVIVAAGLSAPVPVGDTRALADAIRVAMATTPDLRQARAIASNYALEASVTDHVRLFAPFLPSFASAREN